MLTHYKRQAFIQEVCYKNVKYMEISATVKCLEDSSNVTQQKVKLLKVLVLLKHRILLCSLIAQAVNQS